MYAIATIVLLLCAGVAQAQPQPQDGPTTTAMMTPTVEATSGAASTPVVVVVESSRASARPAPVRLAIQQALGATVVGQAEAPAQPRARISVVVADDSSASVHVTLRRGVELTAAIEPTGGGALGLARLAEQVVRLLTTAEADLTLATNARSGLIPWEEEGLRPYPDPGRVRAEALLPWPAHDADDMTGAERRRPGSIEGGGDLSAPPPTPRLAN